MAIFKIHITENMYLTADDLSDEMGEAIRDAMDTLVAQRGILHPAQLTKSDEVVLNVAAKMAETKMEDLSPEEEFLTAGLDDPIGAAFLQVQTQMRTWMQETTNEAMILGVLQCADLVIDGQKVPRGLYNQSISKSNFIVKPHPAILDLVEQKYLLKEDFTDEADNLKRRDNGLIPMPTRLGKNPYEQMLVWNKIIGEKHKLFTVGVATVMRDSIDELITLTFQTANSKDNPTDPKPGLTSKRGSKSKNSESLSS